MQFQQKAMNIRLKSINMNRNQMEANEGGSTIGGNAARAASSLAKFETRLTSEQAF